jgi:hypothetical protein
MAFFQRDGFSVGPFEEERMKPKTLVIFCVPSPDGGNRISPEALSSVRKVLEEMAQCVNDKTVRVLTSTHPCAVATAGTIAQTLRIGQIEKIPQLTGNGTDQTPAAIDPLISGPLAEETNRADTVFIVVDRVNASHLAVRCAQRLYGQCQGEIQLYPCQARTISQDPLQNAIFPQPRGKKPREPSRTSWRRYSSERR